MPKCNTVLQSENDLLNPKFYKIRIEISNFLALRTIKSSECFWHCPVKDKAKAKPLLYLRL